MLKNICRYDKKKSVYLCDRCNSVFTQEKRIAIYVQKGCLEKRNILYDLCPLCFKKFRRGVELYDKNR